MLSFRNTFFFVLAYQRALVIVELIGQRWMNFVAIFLQSCFLDKSFTDKPEHTIQQIYENRKPLPKKIKL